MTDTILTTAAAFFLTSGLSGFYLSTKIYNLGKKLDKKWQSTILVIIMMFMSTLCLYVAAAIATRLSIT